MDRIKFVQHRGVRILQIDYTDCKPKEVIELQKEAIKIITREPEKSVLLVSLVSNAHFDREVSREMKEYVQVNNKYVKASAIVGVTGLQNILINAAIDSAGRPITTFEDPEKAKDWLVDSQQNPFRRVF
jgi:hypothetical protein